MPSSHSKGKKSFWQAWTDYDEMTPWFNAIVTGKDVTSDALFQQVKRATYQRGFSGEILFDLQPHLPVLISVNGVGNKMKFRRGVGTPVVPDRRCIKSVYGNVGAQCLGDCPYSAAE